MNSITRVLPYCLFLTAYFLAFAPESSAAEGSPDIPFARLRDRVRGEFIAKNEKVPVQAFAHLASLGDNGRWADILYDNRKKGAPWGPHEHITRTLILARAYACPEGALSGAPAARDAVKRALAALLDGGFHRRGKNASLNWWHNQIGMPLKMGQTLLVMQDALPDDIRLRAIRAMGNSLIGDPKSTFTGQNLAWRGQSAFYRALLTEDAVLARKAIEAMTSEIRITDHEGIQVDGSFHQHGPQIMTGSYGAAFTVEGARTATILADTPFEFSRARLDALAKHVLEGQSWLLWRGYWDLSAIGRTNSRGPHSAALGIAAAAEILATVDPVRAKDYEALAERIRGDDEASPLIGNRLFWRSGMFVHRRPDWYMSVRTASKRFARIECINGENLFGWYAADGVTWINHVNSHNDYNRLLPVMDWERLPGITNSPSGKVPRFQDVQPMGSSVFSGGVNDGRLGLMAHDYNRGGTHARKAWFFFEDRMVALGANIGTTTERMPETTVNQCLLHEQVQALHEGKWTPLQTDTEGVDPAQAVLHDAVGYLFPDVPPVRTRIARLTGSWQRINEGRNSEKLQEEVFLLSLPHARDGASYHYQILPGAEQETLLQEADATDVVALINSPDLQAVQRTSDRALMAVFYRLGALQAPDVRIRVDRPCALLLCGNQLTAASPLAKEGVLNVTISGKEYAIQLPSKSMAGSSVSISLNP